MKQAMNPYLPLYEYIPDGEPHVFGDRIYVYGSHDRFDGKKFCLNDYVCYSAAVNNLKEWRYEGVIYKKTQDPRMRDGNHELWAPDVVRGKDGRYYLYYCPDDKIRSIGVAVCDSPAGQYAFYGLVQDTSGGIIGERGPQSAERYRERAEGFCGHGTFRRYDYHKERTEKNASDPRRVGGNGI